MSVMKEIFELCERETKMFDESGKEREFEFEFCV